MVLQKRSCLFLLKRFSCALLLLITVMTTGSMAGSWFGTDKKKNKPVSYKDALKGSCNFKQPQALVSLKDLGNQSANLEPDISVQLGHDASCMAMSPDGNYMVSGDWTKLKLWEMESGRVVWTAQVNEVLDVSFSSNGRYIYSLVKGNKGILIWDPLTGKKTGKIPIQAENQLYVICDSYFTDNGSHVILGYDAQGRKTGLFELPSGRKIMEFKGSPKDLSPGGRYVLTEGAEENKKTFMDRKVIYLWNACNGKLIKSWKNKKTPLNHLGPTAFSPDGKFLAMTFYNVKNNGLIHALAMYDPKKGKQLWEGPVMEDAFCMALMFSGSSQVLYYAGNYPFKVKEKSDIFHIYALNPADGQIIRKLDIGSSTNKGFALSQNGKQILAPVYGKKGNAIVFVDNTTFKVKKELKGFTMGCRTAMTQDGNLVTPYHIWDPRTGQSVRRTGLPVDRTFSELAVSPDGKSLILVETSEDLKTLQVIKHNLSTGTEMKTISVSLKEGEKSYFSKLSSDGRFLSLEKCLKSIRIIHIDSGSSILQINAPTGEYDSIYSKSFSPNGEYFAALMNYRTMQPGERKSKIVVWKLSTGKKILDRELTEYGAISSSVITFNPDGKWMFISGIRFLKEKNSDLNTVFKMDTLTGDIFWEASTPYPPSNNILNFEVSRDQKMVAGQNLNGTVTVWDTGTGKVLKKIPGIAGQVVTSLAFSPDNTRIYSDTQEGILIRDAQSGKELSRLFELKGGEWLSMTPEGYYASSEKADQYLNVRVGLQVNGLGQYYEIFYRPDLVARNLKAGKGLETESKPVKHNISKIAASGAPPTVSFASPQQNAILAKRDVVVMVKLKDNGGGIGKIE